MAVASRDAVLPYSGVARSIAAAVVALVPQNPALELGCRSVSAPQVFLKRRRRHGYQLLDASLDALLCGHPGEPAYVRPTEPGDGRLSAFPAVQT
jgi:hypothetical protein